MRISLCLLSLVLFAGTSWSQGSGYTNVDELRGKTKLWVDARGDNEMRQKMIERIRKSLPQVTVLDSFTDAEVLISFNGERHEISGGYEVTKDSVEVASGHGMVAVPIRDAPAGTRPLVIVDYKNTQESRFEKDPWKKFIDKFIEAYKKANRRS